MKEVVVRDGEEGYSKDSSICVRCYVKDQIFFTRIRKRWDSPC